MSAKRNLRRDRAVEGKKREKKKMKKGLGGGHYFYHVTKFRLWVKGHVVKRLK